jgi:hypothetical protein
LIRTKIGSFYEYVTSGYQFGYWCIGYWQTGVLVIRKLVIGKLGTIVLVIGVLINLLITSNQFPITKFASCLIFYKNHLQFSKALRECHAQ